LQKRLGARLRHDVIGDRSSIARRDHRGHDNVISTRIRWLSQINRRRRNS